MNEKGNWGCFVLLVFIVLLYALFTNVLTVIQVLLLGLFLFVGLPLLIVICIFLVAMTAIFITCVIEYFKDRW